ncbi:MAG: ABC transporter ATP-binding protein [Erysipelotrichaceae bacterium]|nr:ABC transporter ATP-binding protein [Erysipelotrichaceae bacterium]MBR2746415.1 ABC transporter ATP-binding protein [Erysipelotrichaceae bacterium]
MAETILKLEKITKVYGNGVVANRDVNIEFKKGEIHSIVGENGAGKSTLMKIIFGIEEPSSGTVEYKGKPANFHGSMEAIKAGIGMVHQHFMLIPSFSVVDNIILGDEPVKGLFIDKASAVKKTQELSDKYNFELNVNDLVSTLSVAKRQKVEILKTLYRDAELIILDEPTSVLTPQETQELFEQLRGFTKQGHTIIFISHKLDEVKQISDRITVLRNGVSKGTYNNDELTMAQLTNLIIDRDLENDMDEFKTHKDFGGKNALEVRNIVMKHHSKNILDDISFAVKKGEILGVAGVDGNGQVDLVKTIVGLEQVEYSGDVIINGEKVNDKTVKERRNMGMAYIPEDRMVDGISGTLPISDNMVSTYYDRDDVSKGALLDNKAISRISDELIEKFAVKAKNNAVAVGSLSGGNVQKVVVAREHNTIPNLMIAEQPTHGIDIGSAELVHHKLIELRNEGAGVLLVSADLNEVIDISDRIIVMFEGHIAGYFPDANNIDETELGMYMLGVKRQTPEEIGGALND